VRSSPSDLVASLISATHQVRFEPFRFRRLPPLATFCEELARPTMLSRVSWDAYLRRGARHRAALDARRQMVAPVRETEILNLEEQQPPQGVFVCDHAGLVNNKFSRSGEASSGRIPPRLEERIVCMPAQTGWD